MKRSPRRQDIALALREWGKGDLNNLVQSPEKPKDYPEGMCPKEYLIWKRAAEQELFRRVQEALDKDARKRGFAVPQTGLTVFLQNAWSPVYAGSHWPRASWLVALQGSRSGRRLRSLLPGGLGCCWNTTPVVGATPGSVEPPCPDHIKWVLAQTAPRIVVACGSQAERAVGALWDGPFVAVPHPTYRVLTTALYEEAATVIADPDFTGRVAFRQRRGSVERVDLIGEEDGK